jgi:2-dehydro-3-deoxyphosphogluconate aldolase / (4S)-4-hydroxy-2-oxoglutarate aldolase
VQTRPEPQNGAPFPRGVVAVIRAPAAATALTVARGLAGTDLAGTDVPGIELAGIEVTMTVPDAPDVIATLRADGVIRVGAGTVRTLDQLKRCVDAGAGFLVSPHFDPQLVAAAIESGVPIVPGALTPSEIVAAINAGAAAVKVFPVSAVGGPAYLRAVLEPLPDARLVPSGEVLPSEVPGYLAAGAWAACLGGSLWPREDAERGDVEAVRRHATRVLRTAAG